MVLPSCLPAVRTSRLTFIRGPHSLGNAFLRQASPGPSCLLATPRASGGVRCTPSDFRAPVVPATARRRTVFARDGLDSPESWFPAALWAAGRSATLDSDDRRRRYGLERECIL